VVSRLFAAVATLRTSRPDLGARLRFTFVGTSNQPDGVAEHGVTALAQSAGIADLVAETPERVPYLEAISLMARADVVLLIGSDEPHYTASKIYPALLSGRPCLGLYHRSSSAFDILSRAGGARVIGFDNLDDLAGRDCELGQAIAEAALRPELMGAVDPAVVAPYHAGAIAARFAAVFDEASRC
jgi:hypothetical protein